MSQSKNISSPLATGGAGYRFENCILASFVVLMLSGGHAPCLPCYPIVKVKPQGRIDGFETDDLIVYVENPQTKEQQKLLCQVKHSISITESSKTFGEVIQAAWNDFNNSTVFNKNKDAIALITSLLNKTDIECVKYLLEQARATASADEFFRHIEQANFSSDAARDKLQVIQNHLKKANDDIDVSQAETWNFLKHFHLLGYDLDIKSGVVLSLLHSHISQFQSENQEWIWSRVLQYCMDINSQAGTITCDNLPEDIRNAFNKQKVEHRIPANFATIHQKPKTDWITHPNAIDLALATLIGSWNEQNPNDIEIIQQFLGVDWQNKVRTILNTPDSPLSVKNGIWEIQQQDELLSQLGSQLFDNNIEQFQSLAIRVLQEKDPAFELPVEDRYMANIRGKKTKYSKTLRNGMANGLALLRSQTKNCPNCSQEKIETICENAIDQLLHNADWVLWGSLNNLLPLLAEAAPNSFYNTVDSAIHSTPCPFDELFSQERSGALGAHYLTGLLWALENLAWEEEHLVNVCVTLAELDYHDTANSNSTNRPFNSLTTILLPWLPQTLASVEKRNVAVQTIIKKYPKIAWKLLIQLLPNQHLISFGSHKPKWRKIVPDDWKPSVTQQDYWKQTDYYAELAIQVADKDIDRLSTLILHLENLPESALNKLLNTLDSQYILELSEEQRSPIFERLTQFTQTHRLYPNADDELLTRIEKITQKLAPVNPFYLYQRLFTANSLNLYEELNNLEEQEQKLTQKREQAITEIFQQGGIDSVIQFAESVDEPRQVGQVLCVIDNPIIEHTLLPAFINSPNNVHKVLVHNFAWRKCKLKGYQWCDNLDKSTWTTQQLAQFLAYLPFNQETWNRVTQWLGSNEKEYWAITYANAYECSDNLAPAVDKLIEYGRPYAAIECLYKMLFAKQTVNSEQCIQALLAACSSNEPYFPREYIIIELIKFLQENKKVNPDDLFKVEWAYLPLLDPQLHNASPKLLENKLANEPEFFCEVIRLIYRSKNENQATEQSTEETKAIATNAWRLLNNWKTIPGTQSDGTFNEECFKQWLEKVKELCTQSGHLEIALECIGEVLIYAPTDPSGLWIHQAIANELDKYDADEMRNGYDIGVFNSRGVHVVDSAGRPEKELAKQWRERAEQIENAGFNRFATTLREMAKNYDKDAQRIISEHTE